MPEGGYPAPWAGRQVAVTLPEQIDVSNAAQVSKGLLGVINRGAAILIVDMTATRSFDYAGADALGRSCQRANANSTALLLVVPGQVMRQVLSMIGLDRLAAIYPSLAAAAAAMAQVPMPRPAELARADGHATAPRSRLRGPDSR